MQNSFGQTSITSVSVCHSMSNYYFKLKNIVFSLDHQLYLPIIIKLLSKKNLSTSKRPMKFDVQFYFENKHT